MLATLRKCIGLLDPQARSRWIVLTPLVVVGAVAEACGAAAVFGLIKIVSNPSQAGELPVASVIYRMLPWHDERTVVLAFAVLVTTFYVFKNSLLVAVSYIQFRVIGDSMATLSRRLLEGYLTAPYTFHLRRNSAELIHNATEAAETVFRTFLASAVAIVAEVMVVLAILSVLMVSAPLVTFVAGATLAIVLTVLLRVTQRTVRRWGAQHYRFKKESLQSAQQALGGLKESRVLGRESFFHEAFSRRQAVVARLWYLYSTLFTAPRLLIETVFVCATLLILTLITMRGGAGSEVIPVLGLYAYAGFRVIPSANRITYHFSQVRYGTASVSRLYDDFRVVCGPQRDRLVGADRRSISFKDRIVLTNVFFTYESAHAPALQDINLTIRAGESVGIVGPTGGGKSTLVDVILGLLPPSSGTVTVDGVDMSNGLQSWHRKIGYVPQSIFLIDDSLRRNIGFGLPDEEIDQEKLRVTVRMAQLEEFVTSLPEGLDTLVGERGVRLSGGQRQRVAIARALYREPEVLIFDEATSALDNQTEREVTRAIAALQDKRTLIMVAHRLTSVSACDRLVFLRDGRIGGIGPFQELLDHNADFRDMASAADTANL